MQTAKTRLPKPLRTGRAIRSLRSWGGSEAVVMGERVVQQEALFYEFSLERHVPETHLLRHIDRFAELDGLRRELVPFYSVTGRPSIDTELLIPHADRRLLLRHPL